MNDITVAFTVVPAFSAFVWAFLLLGVLPLFLTAGAVYILKRAVSTGVMVTVIVLGALLFCAAVLVFLNNDISLNDQSLEVTAGFYKHKVDRDDIIWSEARMTNFEADVDLLPKVRTNGIGLPGYTAGWFVLGSGIRAFMLVTEKPLLYLPARDGSALVLSMDPSSALFKALQREYQIEPTLRERL